MPMSGPQPALPSEEAPVRQLGGFTGRLATLLAVGLSLYAFAWVILIIQPQVYRVSFLLVALVLSFLLFPFRRDPRPADPGADRRVSPFDWMLIAAAVVALSWPLADFDAFIYRAADPLPIDLTLGAVAVLLVLEATRRSVGWILPVTARWRFLRTRTSDRSSIASACRCSRTAATTWIASSARST